MLVIHSSSECDICLEAYTLQSSARSPHAIPCGHTFCNTCIHAISPSNCPLCRRAFRPDSSQRLHVDTLEYTRDERDLDILYRLLLAWEENTPTTVLAALRQEVETLQNRPKDQSRRLEKVQYVLAGCQRMRRRQEEDGQNISQLEIMLQSTMEHALQERDTSRGVEASLLLQVDSLMAKQAKLESELMTLRSALRKSRADANLTPCPSHPNPQIFPLSPPNEPATTRPIQAASPSPGFTPTLNPAHGTSASTWISEIISYLVSLIGAVYFGYLFPYASAPALCEPKVGASPRPPLGTLQEQGSHSLKKDMPNCIDPTQGGGAPGSSSLLPPHVLAQHKREQASPHLSSYLPATRSGGEPSNVSPIAPVSRTAAKQERTLVSPYSIYKYAAAGPSSRSRQSPTAGGTGGEADRTRRRAAAGPSSQNPEQSRQSQTGGSTGGDVAVRASTFVRWVRQKAQRGPR